MNKITVKELEDKGLSKPVAQAVYVWAMDLLHGKGMSKEDIQLEKLVEYLDRAGNAEKTGIPTRSPNKPFEPLTNTP